MNAIFKLIFIFFLLNISFSPAIGQAKIRLRDYFFQPAAAPYSIRFVRETDTNAYLLKKVTTMGTDSIEVADYNPQNQLLQSLVFVVKNDSILVSSGTTRIDSLIYKSEISASVWALATVKRNHKYHFATRTNDNCFIHKLTCYWKWFRHRQTRFKTGKYNWMGERVKTITIQVEEKVLTQPVNFSSISGMNTYTVSYTFAKEIGLIKMEIESKKLPVTVTLIRVKE